MEHSSLLKCFKLSDYQVEDWLTELWQAKTNIEFKALLANQPLLKTLNEVFSSGEKVGLERICSETQKYIEESESLQSRYVSLVLFCYTLYIRENSLGPSVYTQYVEDTRAPLVSKELPPYDLDHLSTKNRSLQAQLCEHFQQDGEAIYHKS